MIFYVKNVSIRCSQAGQQHSAKHVHVDTTQLDLNHKFKLYVVQPPNDYNADKTTYYQLKQLEHSSQDMEPEVRFPRRVLSKNIVRDVLPAS